MSTTWTSIINTDADGSPEAATIGLENGNYTFDGISATDIVAPIVSPGETGGIAFTGLIATGDVFQFGDVSEFTIGTSTGGTLEFGTTFEPSPTDVLFNFDDKLKVYASGVLGLTSIEEEPSPLDYEEGSIVIVDNVLKILK